MAETAELRMSEAVPLAHALVARLAELEGVRILFIKGPTAVALGARPPRPSTDVDVLCEAGGLERLGPALERCRWRRRVPEGAGQELKYAARYLFEHSVHFIHDEWPCDLDIHYNFPGFLAPDEVVFEELWRRRTSVEVAHWPVPCADLLGQSAIVALHGLRDPESPHAGCGSQFRRGGSGATGIAFESTRDGSAGSGDGQFRDSATASGCVGGARHGRANGRTRKC